MKHKEFLRKNRKTITYIMAIFIIVWVVFIFYCLINAPERCAGLTKPLYGVSLGCEKDYGLALQMAIFPTVFLVCFFIFMISAWHFLVRKS